jgi:4'-phosphopantetheinyl transferase
MPDWARAADGDSVCPMALAAGEVELLFTVPEEIRDPTLLAAYRGLMSEDECERNARFKFAEHRHADLVTRALLRWGLSRHAPQVAPAEWRFEREAYGRPRILSPAVAKPLFFNLSHTKGLIACAFATEGAVGLDVEAVGRAQDLEALAHRFFAPAEADALMERPGAERRPRFFDYWTLKEAYIKARGLGLQIPLDAFWYSLGAEGIGITIRPDQNDDPAAWRFLLLEPAAGFRAALAVAWGPPRSALHVRARRVVPLGSDEPFSYDVLATSPVDPAGA